MNMTLGAPLSSVEKRFGPCLPGQGESNKTVSAMRHAAGKGRTFAGIPGIHPNAVFYVHFPLPVDLASIVSKKGVFDFIKDLKQDGPQSDQGRAREVTEFLSKHRAKFEEDRLRGERLAASKAASANKAATAEKKRAEAEAKRREVVAALLERQRKADLARIAASRAGNTMLNFS